MRIRFEIIRYMQRLSHQWQRMWPSNDGSHDDDKDVEGRDQQQFHCTIIVGSPSIQLNYSLYVKYSSDIRVRYYATGRIRSYWLTRWSTHHINPCIVKFQILNLYHHSLNITRSQVRHVPWHTYAQSRNTVGRSKLDVDFELSLIATI